MGSVDGRGGLWRSRWAAIGAAVAVTFGAGGLVAVNAAGGVDSTTVMTDPVRVLDSRDPTDVGLAGPFASRVSEKLQITGSIPTTTGVKTVVPSGATGVLLNVTTVFSTANGFISIRPGDATGLPTTSSLNFEAGQVAPNAVLVALPVGGANDGEIDITFDAYGATGPTTDILIDVVGYTNNSTLAVLQAEIDTKSDISNVNGALLAERTFTAHVSAAGAKSSTGNYTVTKLGTGQYDVMFDVDGLGLPNVFWNAVATTRTRGCVASINSQISSNEGSPFLVSVGFTVHTAIAAGAFEDCGFFLFAKNPGPDVVAPPL